MRQLLQVVTCDMNMFEPKEQFDRIVSIEMFEHMKNYQVPALSVGTPLCLYGIAYRRAYGL